VTVRLTVHYRHSAKTMVTEFGNHADAYASLVSPHVQTADLVVVQELDAPEETVWGRVMTGDEVVAPDGSLWRVEGALGDHNPCTNDVGLTSLDGSRSLTFAVTPEMPVRRRPGVLSAAAQLLHDVGLWSGR
jgi:hypothetical protein